MPVYDFTLTMLSPVHIGTGEDIGPHEYVVKPAAQEGQYILHVIDLPAFLGSLSPPDRRAFDEAVARDALFYIRRFVAERVDVDRFSRYWCSTSQEFYQRYQKGLQNDAAQLLVNTMTRTGRDACPYVPGSSLKGALRTAVLSAIAGQRRDPAPLHELAARNPSGFEPEVLGYASRFTDRQGNPRTRAEIRADPFRAVKVSDAPLLDDALSVDPVEIFNPSRPAGAPDPAGIQMYYEMTYSVLDGQDVRARGTIAIDDRLPTTRTRRDERSWAFDACVARPVTVHQILDACRSFYGERLRKEHEDFYRRRGDLERVGNGLMTLVAQMKGHETLVRLGRFSHFECVTVAGFARPGRRGAGKTRTLAAGELPMGWAELTVEGL